MDAQELKDKIAALPFPKVTADQIEARIERVEYFNIGPTTTICNITLDNGFSVRGESSCVDPRNFDKVIGMELARKDAFGKLWPLFGFVLAESVYFAKERDTDLRFGEAVELLRLDLKVARAGWNGADQWVALQVPDAGSKMGRPYMYLRTVDGVLVPWTPSQSDVLAKDWLIVRGK